MAQIPSPVFSTASVIGSGLMGTGIAAVFAAAKTNVTLIDTDQKRLGESKDRIQSIAAELLSAGLIEENPEAIGARVVCASDLEACRESELILEAIFENLEAGANIDDIMNWFEGLDPTRLRRSSNLLPGVLTRLHRLPFAVDVSPL